MVKKRHNIQEIQDTHWSKDKRERRKPDHPVVYATFKPLADIVASSIENSAQASALDVGCGNGFLQWALQNHFQSVVGIDYSFQMLEVNPCKETCLGSCTALPFPDNSFDVTVAAHLFHHLTESDRMRTLLEMSRVSRQSVISFEPNRNNPLMFLFSIIKQEERMAMRFTSSYMKKLFIKAGVVDVDTRVEGLIVPNKAPSWWIPIGRTLGKTPLRHIGFDICTVGRPKYL